MQIHELTKRQKQEQLNEGILDGVKAAVNTVKTGYKQGGVKGAMAASIDPRAFTKAQTDVQLGNVAKNQAALKKIKMYKDWDQPLLKGQPGYEKQQAEKKAASSQAKNKIAALQGEFSQQFNTAPEFAEPVADVPRPTPGNKLALTPDKTGYKDNYFMSDKGVWTNGSNQQVKDPATIQKLNAMVNSGVAQEIKAAANPVTKSGASSSTAGAPPGKMAPGTRTNKSLELVKQQNKQMTPPVAGTKPGMPPPPPVQQKVTPAQGSKVTKAQGSKVTKAGQSLEEAGVRTGGKIAGQVSQTPNAIRKRNARAAQKQSQAATGGAGAFNQMAQQVTAKPKATVSKAVSPKAATPKVKGLSIVKDFDKWTAAKKISPRDIEDPKVSQELASLSQKIKQQKDFNSAQQAFTNYATLAIGAQEDSEGANTAQDTSAVGNPAIQQGAAQKLQQQGVDTKLLAQLKQIAKQGGAQDIKAAIGLQEQLQQDLEAYQSPKKPIKSRG